MGLPLRMNNLHAPTVPSGPTTARLSNGGAAQLSFTELQRKKENLEAELKALSSVLDSVCIHTLVHATKPPRYCNIRRGRACRLTGRHT